MIRRALFASAVAAALTGCGDGDTSDLRNYVAEVKARKSSNIEPIPQIRPYEPYTYRPADRPSPFEPFAESRTQERQGGGSGVQPNFERNPEPLEEYPLDALRMAGTLTVAGQRYALVKAPDGVVHRVTTGNHMGQNYGQIVAINNAEVRLTEIVPDGLGGYMKRTTSLALSD